MRSRDVSGLEARVRRKSKEKRLVGKKVIQHASAEAWIGSGSPQIVRTKPGHGKKSCQTLRIRREEGQRRDPHR
jgi:hypothetical protein